MSLDPREHDTVTIFERSRAGRRAFVAPADDVPEVALDELLPASQRRETPAELPEVSEPELVRHYVTLSSKNFHLDEGFYPLGSCTMKHNPKLHERVAALPGHARLHPLQDAEYAQGALELMWRLQGALAEIAGLPHVSLQPSAGSHGELAGLLLTRAYHEDRGEQRTKVLTPDTAHGTNPATVTMAGYEVVKVGTGGGRRRGPRRPAREGRRGRGLPDAHQPQHARPVRPQHRGDRAIVHGVGATLYYDGANLNAVMGISRPGDMGFDIVHFNLHKTFTQPHGGGGPGAGPIAVSERIEPFLPVPQVVGRRERRGPLRPRLTTGPSRSASCAASRATSASSCAPTRTSARWAATGCEDVSRDRGAERQLPQGAAGRGGHRRVPADRLRPPLHARVRAVGHAARRRSSASRTLDIAKRLLDHGVHPPTVYFPLLVEEALMIEPTETETKERLDHFADALRAILDEAAEDPEIARNAPYTTPVRRLDEAGAAKRPVVRWRPEA